MACGYGKESMLNAELLNPRAQHIKCRACSLLRWGLRVYLSVLNICSSSADPGTITITNSATLTHSPNLSHAPTRVDSPHNSLAVSGPGGGAVLILAPQIIRLIAGACCSRVCSLCCCCSRTALSVTGRGWGGRLKRHLHLTFHCPLWCSFFQKSLELVCGPKACCFFNLYLLLISWAVVACFLHWKMAGQMAPMGLEVLPFTFPLANLGFF